jgi:hypothetical protein
MLIRQHAGTFSFSEKMLPSPHQPAAKRALLGGRFPTCAPAGEHAVHSCGPTIRKNTYTELGGDFAGGFFNCKIVVIRDDTLLQSILSISFARWFSTVRTLIPSLAPMALFE